MSLHTEITKRYFHASAWGAFLFRSVLFLGMMLLLVPDMRASDSGLMASQYADRQIGFMAEVSMLHEDPPLGDQPRSREHYSRRDRFYGIRHWFVGIHLGSMNVFTDLSGKPGDGILEFPGFVWNDVGFLGGVFFRYKLNEWFAMGAALSYASIEAARRTEEGSDLIHAFQTSLGELSLRADYFWPTLEWSPWDVYAFTGLAIYMQQTSFLDGNGMKINLEHYPDIVNPKLAFPLGAGVSYVIADRVKLGYELSYRFTGNHILDGVFVEGSGADSYMFHSINISIPIANRARY
jgi:hypothetical protein